MISTNTVCASGTDLQTKEECEAFNGSDAGTWQGDLSGSPAHVAVHPRGCWLWGDSNRHWIQPDGVLQTEASSKPICYGIPASTTESPTVDPSLAPTASPTKPPTLAAVVMGATNMVCPFGTGLQTKEECEAFNAPGAGSWHGDLSASAAHLAVHPRGCFLWSDSNRHWIQPDGVLQTEALSKPICYGSSALEPVVMISTNTVCASGTDLQTKEECEAFNGSDAGTWQGDLSGSPAHVAVHPRGCWLWGDSNRHWIQPDGVLQTEALSKPICYGSLALEPVVMSSTNTVCASGTDLQTKEECEAFNGPSAGIWHGDLSSSAAHVAVHPRGCWLWGDANRHWIQPDGVLQTEAFSKPICYGTPGSPSSSPVSFPSNSPSSLPTDCPSTHPSSDPTFFPSNNPTGSPSFSPSSSPSTNPSSAPSSSPSSNPSSSPTLAPSSHPSESPSSSPSRSPTAEPTNAPTASPSNPPTAADFIVKIKGFHGKPVQVLDSGRMKSQPDVEIDLFAFEGKVTPLTGRLISKQGN